MEIMYKILNSILTPLRLFLPHDMASKLKLITIKDERISIVLSYVKGKVLDIGCGLNELVNKYNNDSIGVDIYDFGSNATIIKDSSNLPFENNSFDTVTFVASLNHIPYRKKTIREASRVLVKDGLIIITNLQPLIGKIRHLMFWIDKTEDLRYANHKQEGERDGLENKEIIEMLKKNNFKLILHRRFLLKLNNILVFQKDF